MYSEKYAYLYKETSVLARIFLRRLENILNTTKNIFQATKMFHLDIVSVKTLVDSAELSPKSAAHVEFYFHLLSRGLFEKIFDSISIFISIFSYNTSEQFGNALCQI